MLDTTPDEAGPRALAKELREARAIQLRLVRQLALATSDPERDLLRLELGIQAARIATLTERREELLQGPPSFERR
jgi:hypothetical protein